MHNATASKKRRSKVKSDFEKKRRKKLLEDLNQMQTVNSLQTLKLLLGIKIDILSSFKRLSYSQIFEMDQKCNVRKAIILING